MGFIFPIPQNKPRPAQVPGADLFFFLSIAAAVVVVVILRRRGEDHNSIRRGNGGDGRLLLPLISGFSHQVPMTMGADPVPDPKKRALDALERRFGTAKSSNPSQERRRRLGEKHDDRLGSSAGPSLPCSEGTELVCCYSIFYFYASSL